MPECPEVTILSDYLNDKLVGTKISSLQILSGKYLNKKIVGKDLLNGSTKYDVVNVKSKGKVLYIELSHNKTTIYFVSHLGMSGEWSITESDTDRIRLKTTKFDLCYKDPRNFGNVEVLTSDQFYQRINKIAQDVLKTNFTDEEFYTMIQTYLSKSKKRHSQSIFKMLTKQNASDGIFSGLGNYLIPEILYDAKISPYRSLGDLSYDDCCQLAHSIKYITKLSYYNNVSGYMTNFGDYMLVHKKGIDSGIYENYHPDTKLKKNEKFTFKIYQKKKDPLGNPVEKDKVLNKGRTTHWVKNVQI